MYDADQRRWERTLDAARDIQRGEPPQRVLLSLLPEFQISVPADLPAYAVGELIMALLAALEAETRSPWNACAMTRAICCHCPAERQLDGEFCALASHFPKPKARRQSALGERLTQRTCGMPTKETLGVTESTEKTVPKQRGRPLPKSVSGNPEGCRTGSRHRATILIEQLMAGDAEAVVHAVVEKAKGGDMVAAKIILDRLIPPRKGRPVPLDLPAVRAAGDLLAAQRVLIEGLAAGDLTPEEASAVSSVLEGNRKMIETEELAMRLQRLEERVGAGR